MDTYQTYLAERHIASYHQQHPVYDTLSTRPHPVWRWGRRALSLFALAGCTALQPQALTTDVQAVIKSPPPKLGQLVTVSVVARNTSEYPYESLSLSNTYDTTKLRPISGEEIHTSPDGTVDTKPFHLPQEPVLIQGTGHLTPGAQFQYNLTFMAIGTTDSTCVITTANVSGYTEGKGTDTAQACFAIEAPPPPQ